MQRPRRRALAARREEAAARRAAGLLATGRAHLGPGRQQRGPEHQVSQKFPGLRCCRGRHLKQETRRGEAKCARAGRRHEGGEGRARPAPRAPLSAPPTRFSPAPGPLRPAPPLFVIGQKDSQKWVPWLYIPFGALGFLRDSKN